MPDTGVEVLTVPDERLGLQREPSADMDGLKCYASEAMSDGDGLPVLYEGDFVVVDTRWPISDMNGLRIPGEYAAALLDALLSDAPEIEIEIGVNMSRIVAGTTPPDLEPGRYKLAKATPDA